MTYSPFSPASLFSGGAPGVWYDPSDINLNWRYNLLTYTEQFDNAAWTKTNVTVTANAAVAPDGTTTADLVIATNINGSHTLTQQPNNTASGLTPLHELRVKYAGHQYVQLYYGSASDPNNAYINFDLINGVVTSNYVSVGSIVSMDDGWWLISANTLVDSVGQLNFALIATASATSAASFTGDGTSGIYIWGASLTSSENATKPYQQIVTPEISYYTYQPQPILFQDSAGTTPVTAVEQPVGLMLDKSKGLVLGSELVTNGDFSDGTTTGWTSGSAASTASVVAGEMRVTSVSASGRQVTAISTVIGTTYKVSGVGRTISGSGSPGASLYLTSSTGTTIIGGNINYTTSNEPLGLVFTATATTSYIAAIAIGNIGSVSAFDNISVKELPGNHAFQSTSASRPVLSARYNLLTKTEQFGDAAWTKTDATVTANAATAPDGTTTADLLIETAATGNHRVSQTAGTLQAQTLMVSISHKAGVGTRNLDFAIVGGGNFVSSVFSTATGEVLANNDFAGVIFSGKQNTVSGPDAQGFYTATITVNLLSAQSVSVVYGLANGTSNNYTGNGTSGIYIWGASLVPSNQSTLPYQRVNTATDYATTGFLPYLKFDGVDDSLSTNSISFTSTDKMSVFAGVRKLGSAPDQIIIELSSSVSANNGAFWLAADVNSSTEKVSFATKGTVFQAAFTTSTAYNYPVTVATTGVGDISGDRATLRINGVQVAQNTGDQGTGNYGNYPLYIGRRGGSSLPFNGQLYSMTIVGKQVTTTELSSTETYTAIKTGVTLA